MNGLLMLSAAHSAHESVLENVIHFVVPELIVILELIGVIIIAIGAVKAVYYYVKKFANNKDYNIKLILGEALALGLEFNLGAEILKTIVVRELSEMYVLAAIIVMRVVLSLLLHFEVHGDEKHEQKELYDRLRNKASE